MKSSTATAMATALEALAAALREEAKEPEKQAAMPLSVAAKESGYPVSTLRELCLSRLVEGTRRGKGRGRWYVTTAAIEAYERSRTQRPLLRAG